MTTNQIIHIQQVVIEFLREQLAVDSVVDKTQAEICLLRINTQFDWMAHYTSEELSNAWIDFFQSLMQARVYHHDQKPLGIPSTFCNALTITHVFLWRALQNSTLKTALNTASEAALKEYNDGRFFLPAYLAHNPQESFEVKRVQVAALNNENILNNDDPQNQHQLQLWPRYSLIKRYPISLFQINSDINSRVEELERNLFALSAVISRDQLIKTQFILLDFLAGQPGMEDSYANELNANFVRLIKQQSSENWTTLLLNLMNYRIAYYPKTPTTSENCTLSKLGDAFRVVHMCILQMINDHYAINNECSILHPLNKTKQLANETLDSLLRHSGNAEAVERAQILSAALGNEQALKIKYADESYPQALCSKNDFVNLQASQFQRELKNPALMSPEKTKVTKNLTATSATLFPNVTVRNNKQKSRKKHLVYSPTELPHTLDTCKQILFSDNNDSIIRTPTSFSPP